jgi:predicted SAM-dependent methyltransferase
VFLRRLETNWQVFGVEGSELTRVELEHDGIQVLRDLGVAVKSHANQFRVITLFQVLEHIADFEEMLRQCNALLEPGGHLVVTVPDGDAMIRQERVTGCHDMPPNHINKWTPESLSLVMRRVGFECATPIYEPPSWRNVKANLHMRMIADAAKGDTVAAQVYRIRNRRFRFAALSFLGVQTMLRMFRYGRQLRLGGAFAIVGVVAAQHRGKVDKKV